MGDIGIEAGSGNVFADIGLPNAEQHLIKAHLVFKIAAVIEERGLTQMQAAQVLGIGQPQLSEMLRGQFSRSSVEKLLRHLVALGQDVEIAIKSPASNTSRPGELRIA